MIVSGHDNGYMTVWDTTSGDLLYVIRAHTSSIVYLHWLPQANTVISGGRDGKVGLHLSNPLLHTLPLSPSLSPPLLIVSSPFYPFFPTPLTVSLYVYVYYYRSVSGY